MGSGDKNRHIVTKTGISCIRHNMADKRKSMDEIKEIFRRYAPQTIHIITIPVFFFGFMMIYTPLGAQEYLGGIKPGYAFHITMMACIIAASEGLTRSLLYIFRRKIGKTQYIFWCMSEMIAAALFMGLYIWLMKRTAIPYFSAVAWSLAAMALTSTYPYVIIAMALILNHRKRQLETAEEGPDERIRFYDSRKVLKLVVSVSSIYYIGADENYVNIFYMEEGGKTKKYVLRASMKSIEDICTRNSLVRCHRSYFVNPAHIKILRKAEDGLVFADIDTPEPVSIPVTKRYYDNVAAML